MGRKMLVMSDVFFQGILGDGERNYIVSNGLPEDARVVDVRIDFRTRDIEFIITSSQWPDVSEGMPSPPFEPRIVTKVANSSEPAIRFREYT